MLDIYIDDRSRDVSFEPQEGFYLATDRRLRRERKAVLVILLDHQATADVLVRAFRTAIGAYVRGSWDRVVPCPTGGVAMWYIDRSEEFEARCRFAGLHLIDLRANAAEAGAPPTTEPVGPLSPPAACHAYIDIDMEDISFSPAPGYAVISDRKLKRRRRAVIVVLVDQPPLAETLADAFRTFCHEFVFGSWEVVVPYPGGGYAAWYLDLSEAYNGRCKAPGIHVLDFRTASIVAAHEAMEWPVQL